MAAGLEPEPTAVRSGDKRDISMFELLTPLVRQWKLIFGTAAACAVGKSLRIGQCFERA